MGEPVEHKNCRDFLKAQAAERGVDVHVSAAPPIVASAYGENSFLCPHHVEYWMEPTSEQIAQWVKDGTP